MIWKPREANIAKREVPHCGDVKGCPASHYMNCIPFSEGVSCWEIRRGCLCHVYPDCTDCLIYQGYLDEYRR